MTMQKKVLFLLISLMIIFILGVYLDRVHDKDKLLSLVEEERNEKISNFDKLLDIKGNSLETIVYDYTAWDELADFVKTRKKDWVDLNLNNTFFRDKAYDICAVCVYDTKFSPVYIASDIVDEQNKDFPMAKEIMKKIFSKESFCHFFLKVPEGLLEIRGASIHRASDKGRTGKPEGYFFVARMWDEEYLKELGEVTGCKIKITNFIEEEKVPNKMSNGIINFSKILKDCNNKPLVYLDVSMESNVIKNFNLTSSRFFVLLSVFYLFILAFISIILIRWISLPLKSISKALKTEDPVYLDKLKNSQEEFGDISRLICQFFENKSAIVKEISEHKRTEEALRIAKEEADNLNRQLKEAIDKSNELVLEAKNADFAKGQFLANMSHEIRTPMNSILGMIDLTLNTQLTSEQKYFLNIVKNSSEALLFLINDILDFSKIESGQVDIEESPFNIRDLIGRVIDTFAIQVGNKGIELIYYVDAAVSSEIIGDQNLLRQILVNLIGNSIKFTEDGEILVLVESEKSSDKNKMRLHFSVSDTGIGIPEDKVEKIFKRFSQADLLTGRKFGGTGLGLSICKSLVELLGGKIWVESAVAMGSKFHFVLSFKFNKKETKKLSTIYPDFMDKSVLVIDNNKTQRDVLSNILKNWGFNINKLEISTDGLKILNNIGNKYDLIIINVVNTDIIEYIRLIRNNKEGESVKIITISKSGMIKQELMNELNIYTAIIKPLVYSKLLEVLLGIYRPPKNGAKISSPNNIGKTNNRVGKIKILLVEDNVDNQFLTRILLEKAGYEVDIAENGRIALEKTENFVYDLIFMDINIPEIDGLVVTREIRAREKRENKQRVPIVALTAQALSEYKEQSFEAGMDEYITKPFKKDIVLACITKYIEKTQISEENKKILSSEKFKILLVEDNIHNQIFTRILLEKSGYEVHIAESGKKAFEFLDKLNFDLILMDMNMPDMEGTLVAEEVRLKKGDAIPVIAFTAYKSTEYKEKAFHSGMNDFIVKPFTANTLISTIDKWIKKEKKENVSSENEEICNNEEGDSLNKNIIYVEEDLKDMLPLFLQNCRDNIKKIQTLLEEDDMSHIRTIGHDMKGIGSIYGCDEISIRGGQIEDAVKHNDKESITEAIEKLHQYLSDVCIISLKN